MMNKAKVIVRVSQLSDRDVATCARVIEALERVSGSTVGARVKGLPLDRSPAAVEEVAALSGVGDEDCRQILSAFEQAFEEELRRKFPFFRKKRSRE